MKSLFRNYLWTILIGAAVVAALYGLSLYSYILFHSLIELFSIAVAISIFTFAWNTRAYMENDYFLCLGVASGFIGLLDIVHTLAYKGMGVFVGFDANLPTQLWIAMQYIQSLAFLTASLFLTRKINPYRLLVGYLVVTTIVLVSIFTHFFPDCFIEGKGLTPFKIASEYIISAIFLASIFVMYKNKEKFEQRIFRLLIVSILLAVGGEIAFTSYVSVYGFANFVGHILRAISFIVIYQAIIQIGIREPYHILFHNLQQSEELYRLLAENMKDVVWIFDPQEMRFRYISPSVKELTGYTVEEALVQKPIEYIKPELQTTMAKVIQDHMETFLAGQGATFTDLIERPRKDGSMIWVEIRSHYYTNQTSGRLEIHGVERDITERKRAEDLLRTTQKYTDLGTMAAGMAHEMNSPLQVITGSADSILESIRSNNPMDPSRMKRYLENISRNGWRIAALVRAPNLYARPADSLTESNALNEIIHDTLLLIEHQLKAWSNIKVEQNLGNPLPTILCDRNEITQVLINLLTNARDAMPTGGTIKISSAYHPSKNEVTLEVQDDGTGMPPDVQEKIFDPFFTTKPVGKGTGLGLSIVQGIMRTYGGSIELESTPREGTTLRLIFPVGGTPVIYNEERRENEKPHLGRYI